MNQRWPEHELIVKLRVTANNAAGAPVINLGQREAYYDARDDFDDYFIELDLSYRDQVFLEFSFRSKFTGQPVQIRNVKIASAAQADLQKYVTALPGNRFLLDNTTLAKPEGNFAFQFTYQEKDYQGMLQPFLVPSAALYMKKTLPYEYQVHLGSFRLDIAERKKLQIIKLSDFSGAKLVSEQGGTSAPYN